MNNNISNTYNSSFIDSLLIWLITICSLRFFTLFIPLNIAKAVVLMGVVLILFFLIIHIVYGNGSIVRKRFLIEIGMIFIALIISAFAAEFFHGQSILSTFLAQFEFYMFFFYFLIHRIKPDPDKLLNMFIWLGYIYAVIYFLQYLVYPVEIVSSKTSVERGTIRIMMPGAEYMVATWFILLSRYFKTKNIMNIIGLFPFIMILILLGTRQILAPIALLTLLNILLSKALKSKVLMIILIALAIIPFYFLFQDILNQLIKVSHKELSGMQGNIRYLAAHYFLFDLNHNPIWILTGNGMPASHSEYDKFLTRISEELGYYQSDIGIIGDFSKFGILLALAVIISLIKLSLYRCREKYSFIRYNALMMLMTFFTGAGLRASIIIFICLMFYIVEADKQFT